MNYFDLHCDTPFECYRTKQPFSLNNLAVSGKAAACFEQWSQVFAIWINDNAKHPYELYRSILSDFSRKLFGSPENLTAYFSVEGGAVIEDRPERLEVLKKDGIRALSLTWNGENRIAGGVASERGLTDFGREVVCEMNRLNMFCDLSHLNRKSFDGVLELSKRPFVSHADCDDVFANPRNLPLDSIRRVAEKGGVVGICFYPKFCGTPVFEAIYRQIYFLAEHGLENSIAIGSDFDGAKMSPELDSAEKIPHLFDYLCRKGLPKELILKIFYQNAYNFFVCL